MSEEIKIYDLLEYNGMTWINIDRFKFLQQKVEQLEKENKILKENAEHNDRIVDKVNWENMLLRGKLNKGSE